MWVHFGSSAEHAGLGCPSLTLRLLLGLRVVRTLARAWALELGRDGRELGTLKTGVAAEASLPSNPTVSSLSKDDNDAFLPGLLGS